MNKEKILVVDDEEDIQELVKFNLHREGYAVLCAASGEDGLAITRDKKPDLIILDLMLPGVDGLDVCRILKNDPETKRTPIVMLTAKGEEADIVTGLELGADDYITKPFSPRILSARVKGVLRRQKVTPIEQSATLTIEDLTINPGRHEVFVKRDKVELTNTEFKILHLFARQPGLVFTRSQIVDRVHGEDYPVTDRSVDVQIVGLRKKLKSQGESIETVRGVGYRFRG